MEILAIETSTLTGSVAWLSGEEILAETTLSVSARHSERLMPAVDHLVGHLVGEISKNTEKDLSAVDLFAVSCGPGSFTGLRIGIAAAQGLAMAHHKSVVGVSTLEALALNGSGFEGIIVPLLDAFRGEVYRGLYRSEGGSLSPVAEDRVVSMKDLEQELEEKTDERLIVGNIHLFSESLKKKSHILPPSLRYPRASNVAVLAWQQWQKGLPQEPILPRYLRMPG